MYNKEKNMIKCILSLLFGQRQKIKLLLKKLEEKGFSIDNCTIEELIQFQLEINEIQAYKITAKCDIEKAFKFNDFLSRVNYTLQKKKETRERKLTL